MDFVVNVNQYQGNLEVYINSRNNPSGVTDSSIDLFSAQSSKRTLVLRSNDRLALGLQTGLYVICFYSYSDSSLSVLA